MLPLLTGGRFHPVRNRRTVAGREGELVRNADYGSTEQEKRKLRDSFDKYLNVKPIQSAAMLNSSQNCCKELGSTQKNQLGNEDTLTKAKKYYEQPGQPN